METARRPIQPYREIIKEIQEINKAFEKAYLVGNVRARRLGRVGWKPLPKGWLKLNVNGASVEIADKAGCGGLLRNENGKWVAGLTHTIGNCSAFIAELWGVVQGLNLARRLGMKKIMVECDSEGVVKLLNGERKLERHHNSLIRMISELKKLDWRIILYITTEKATSVQITWPKRVLILILGFYSGIIHSQS
ncbi:hypothetical protein AHAS_Ahas13G0376900 [Arachis hypogaea]